MKKKNQRPYVTRTLTMPDGTRKYVYGKTKTEAEAKIKELRLQIGTGICASDITFRELANQWVQSYKEPFVSAGTLRNIKSCISSHFLPYLGDLRLRDITPIHCQTVAASMVSAGYTNYGAAMSHLRSIFDVGVSLGHLNKNPVSAVPRPPRRALKKDEKQVLPKALSEEILRRLTPGSAEQLFYLIGRETGARRGEILALDWQNIDLNRQVIHLRQNLTHDASGRPALSDFLKTESGRRTVPATPTLCDVLSARPVKEGLVFGELYTKRKAETVWLHIRKVCASLNAAYAENFTPHVLRHTYITRLFEAGLDVKEIQALAGHKDVSTTLGAYAHYDKASRQEATFEKVRNLS